MILLEIVYLWSQEGEVKPVKDSHYIHKWCPSRRHDRLVFLISNIDERHRHLRAYGLISLGVLCLMEFNESLNHDEIALKIDELCCEIGKRAIGSRGIKDFENIHNLIINSIIMATINTLNIAPERIFMWD